jgi:hypothetical protein
MELLKTNHHATLYVSQDRETLTTKFWNDINSSSAAAVIYPVTVLDVEHARELIRWAQAPYEGDKVALVSFHTITIPAQNALLKIVEEPRAGVSFIFVTSNLETILPTLYSRLHHYRSTERVQSNEDVLLFLKTPHGERMKLPCITELLSRVDEGGRKDREAVRSFILSLACEQKTCKELLKYSKEIIECASYSSDASASGKAIIEYLALLLPQVDA